jgi:TolB-like protein
MSIRCTVLAALGALAQAGIAATTAVAPFHNATGNPDFDPLCYGLPELISAALATSTNVVVVDRACLDAVIAEKGLSFAGNGAAETGVKLGGLVQADTVLTGSFIEADGKLRVTVQVTDVASAVILRSVTGSGSTSDLVALCAQLARDVAGTTDAASVDLTGIPIDTSPVPNLHVMRGLQDYWRGEHLMAVASFMRARDIAPRHADAVFWTAKSYAAARDWGHAWIEVTRFAKVCAGDPRVAEAEALKRICESHLKDWERQLLIQTGDGKTHGANKSD